MTSSLSASFASISPGKSTCWSPPPFMSPHVAAGGGAFGGASGNGFAAGSTPSWLTALLVDFEFVLQAAANADKRHNILALCMIILLAPGGSAANAADMPPGRASQRGRSKPRSAAPEPARLNERLCYVRRLA